MKEYEPKNIMRKGKVMFTIHGKDQQFATGMQAMEFVKIYFGKVAPARPNHETELAQKRNGVEHIWRAFVDQELQFTIVPQWESPDSFIFAGYIREGNSKSHENTCA